MKVARKVKKSSKQGNTTSKAVKPDLFNVTAEDYNWGTIFTGSKAALIRSKLAPAKFKSGTEYRLPLDHSERYMIAMATLPYDGTPYGRVPQTWEATITHIECIKGQFSVMVDFDKTRDLNIRERADPVEVALKVLLKMVRDIAPRPLSAQIPEAIAQKSEVVKS